MKRLLIYLNTYKKECVFAPLFKMLEAIFELFVPLVMASMIDKGIGNADHNYILKMCFVLLALATVGLVCAVTAQYFAAKAAVGFATKLRHSLLAHIQSLSFSKIDTVGTSTLITRMTSDVNQVQTGVNMVLRLFLRSPFIVFGSMVMAFTIDVKLALIFAGVIPLLSIVVFGVMLITMPMYKKVQSVLDKILGITRENLTGVRVIRAFGKEDDEIANFENHNSVLTVLQKSVGKISALMNPITYLMINIAMIILIWKGAVRVDIGSISQGQVVALVSYMSQILLELVKLANLIILMTKSLASAKRIENIFDMEAGIGGQDVKANEKGAGDSDVYSIQEARDSEHSEYSEHLSQTNPPNLAVEFKSVSLTYENSSSESLSDINFEVLKGETVGIIGGTGSGKTSVVNLIPRFYDVSKGNITVNGIDVKEQSVSELRSKIGIVMQKAVLFKGTIRENLCWGKENVSDEELLEVLSIAQAKDFVMEKEGKLEFLVSQDGSNLSGGQKQRLTIARALVRNPEILILDDSASALDFATDARLRMAIREMKNAPTVFIVSQRAASLIHADKIIVMDDGQIAGMGTHEELLNNCAVYQEIYYSQFRRES